MIPVMFDGYDHLPRNDTAGSIATCYGLAKLGAGWTRAAGSNLLTGNQASIVDHAGYVSIQVYLQTTPINSTTSNTGYIRRPLTATEANISTGFSIQFKAKGTPNSQIPLMEIGSVSNASARVTVPGNMISENEWTHFEIVVSARTSNYNQVRIYINRSLWKTVNVTFPLPLNDGCIALGPSSSVVYNHTTSEGVINRYYRDLVIMKPDTGETPGPMGVLTITKLLPTVRGGNAGAWTEIYGAGQDSFDDIMAALPVGADNQVVNTGYMQSGLVNTAHSVRYRPSAFLYPPYVVDHKRAVLGVLVTSRATATVSGDRVRFDSWIECLSTGTAAIDRGTINTVLQTTFAQEFVTHHPNNPAGSPWTIEDVESLRFWVAARYQSGTVNTAALRVAHATAYVLQGELPPLATGKGGLDSLKDLIDVVSDPDASDLVTYANPIQFDTNAPSITLVPLTPTVESEYEGDYTVFYHRRTVLDALSNAFVLPAGVTNSFMLLPYINAYLGSTITEADILYTEYQPFDSNTGSLRLESNPNSWFFYPSARTLYR